MQDTRPYEVMAHSDNREKQLRERDGVWHLDIKAFDKDTYLTLGYNSKVILMGFEMVNIIADKVKSISL